MTIPIWQLMALRDDPNAALEQIAAAHCALVFSRDSRIGRDALEVCRRILEERWTKVAAR